MAASTYTIKALDELTWPAYAALVEANNGVFGGCWCMGFHPEGGEKDMTAARSTASANCSVSRRAPRTRRSCSTVTTAWAGASSGHPRNCRGSRATWRTTRVVHGVPDWRIACCFVGKGHRRKGVFAAGLAGALDLIAGYGGGVVKGYPEDSESVPAGFLYNGALSTYEALGFSRDRMIGKHRWVVRKVVPPKESDYILVYEYAAAVGGEVPPVGDCGRRRPNP